MDKTFPTVRVLILDLLVCVMSGRNLVSFLLGAEECENPANKSQNHEYCYQSASQDGSQDRRDNEKNSWEFSFCPNTNRTKYDCEE